eukprot:m.298942 g.298942  ORF g.298942 m.298942 type:complete len:54 (-) comp98213_c0_seq1:8-169(-)
MAYPITQLGWSSQDPKLLAANGFEHRQWHCHPQLTHFQFMSTASLGSKLWGKP